MLMRDVLKPRKGFSPRERSIFTSVWDNSCAYCEGSKGPFAIDHIIPHSKGGSCEYDNLCLACVKCNAKKSAKRLPTYYEGLLLATAKVKARRIIKRLSCVPAKSVKPKKDVFAGWSLESKEHARKVAKILNSLLELEHESSSVPGCFDGLLPPRNKLTFKINAASEKKLGFTFDEVFENLRKTIIVYEKRGKGVAEVHANLNLSSYRNTITGEGTFSIHMDMVSFKEFVAMVDGV
tara:strand:+ start:557 stop:1264 length:708 start_codon:yes stop_codon:yes gene_type:complete